MLLILFFSFFIRADKKNQEKSPVNKENMQDLQDVQNKKKKLSKKMNKKQENHVNKANSNSEYRNNRKKNQIDDLDSMQKLANNLQKLKAGVEVYKVVNKNNDHQSEQPKQTYHRNKMFDILDQIRERYAPPTTPISHITFTSVFITLVAIVMIIVIAYFMISRFFRIKSSEINEEEIPLIFGQMNQEQHDLSVHGFSKI